MFQRDFIMRQIEELMEALIEILHLRRESELDAAQRLISYTAKRLLGFDLDITDSLSTGDLLTFLQHNAVFDTGKSYIIARLLLEQAAIVELEKQELRAYTLREKALLLLLEPVIRDNRFGSVEDHRLIRGIVNSLDEDSLPAVLRSRLMDYYEMRGAYDRAEDILLIAKSRGEQLLIDKGHGFYLRLSHLQNTVLEKGNFSREEVEDGLKSFPAKS